MKVWPGAYSVIVPSPAVVVVVVVVSTSAAMAADARTVQRSGSSIFFIIAFKLSWLLLRTPDLRRQGGIDQQCRIGLREQSDRNIGGGQRWSCAYERGW